MVRLGIIATGRVAHRFVPEARTVAGIIVAAVYSPHAGRAEQFAKEWGIPAFYENLEDFIAEIDAGYVASPHKTHYQYAKALIGHGRHVLCEKPLALAGAQARELFSMAEEKGCVLMEALKTAYCSGYLSMMEAARGGRIGRVKDVEACFTRLTPTNMRELKDRTYGGSFTELGSYTMLPVFELLGTEYKEVHFKSQLAENGLDVYTRTEFTYDGAWGTAKTGLLVKSEGQLVISGTKGYILAKSPWWMTKEYEVRYEDPSRIEINRFGYEGPGLRYEVEAFVKAVAGELSLSHAREISICMADTMERFMAERKEKEEKKIKEENVKIQVGNGIEEKGQREDEEVAFTCHERAGRENKYPCVKVWAHRGMSYVYPENTLEAFEAAAKLEGLTGIELDVQLSKDGEIVVIHDEEVDRTTDGTGLVKNYSMKELQLLKIKGATGTGTQTSIEMESRIPSLREVFTLLKPYCLKNNLLINIELKNSRERYEGLEAALIELVREYGLESYVWYSSFLAESMREIKRIEPSAKTGVLDWYLEDCITSGDRVSADALHPNIAGLNVKLPEQWKGKPVRAWNGGELFYGQEGTFRETELEQYGWSGVTDVFTNVPERYLCRDTGGRKQGDVYESRTE